MRDNLNEYLVTAVGSVIGATLLIPVGIFLSYSFENATGHHGLESLLFRAVGIFGGWWVGSVSGCWLALLKRPLSNAKLTATLLAMLTPLGILWFFHIGTKVVGSINRLEFWLLIGFTIIVLSLLARLLTNMFRSVS